MDQERLNYINIVVSILASVVGILGVIKVVPVMIQFITKKIPDVFWSSYLKKFLKSALVELGKSKATGTNHISLSDLLFTDSFFIKLHWETYDGMEFSGELIDFLKDKLESGEKVLLVGESGQGKSTVLRRLFVMMADDFLHRRGKQAPIFIKLRELYAFANGPVTLDTLWSLLEKDNLNPFPLSFKKFAQLLRDCRVVLILDGLDEILRLP